MDGKERLLESNPKQIPKFQLCDIVADVLVVHEVAVRVLGFVVANSLFDVGLECSPSVIQ